VNGINQTYASVDWLTVTATQGATRDALMLRAREALERAREQNLEIKDWTWCGYTGWIAESFRCGSRNDSDIVILSGPACGRYWRDFAGEGDNISRLDLAVTVELDKPDEMVLINYWDALERYKEKGHPAKFTFTMIYNSKGGQTLYIGQRTSRQMGRCYDKGIEAGDGLEPGKLWRYEVELKKPLSKPLARSLYGNTPYDEVGEKITGYVYEWFASRRVTPRFPKVENVILVEVEMTARTDESRLKWLSQQVAPSCQSLISRGKLDEVLCALGIDGVVEKRSWMLDQSELIEALWRKTDD
jgi:hypothetical protein